MGDISLEEFKRAVELWVEEDNAIKRLKEEVKERRQRDKR